MVIFVVVICELCSFRVTVDITCCCFAVSLFYKYFFAPGFCFGNIQVGVSRFCVFPSHCVLFNRWKTIMSDFSVKNTFKLARSMAISFLGWLPEIAASNLLHIEYHCLL